MISLDFGNPFELFFLTFYHAIIVVLLQKNPQGFEKSIDLKKKNLQVFELKYVLVEKKVHSLFKDFETFRMYLVGAQKFAYVLNVVVKDIFVQYTIIGKRCRWIKRF